MSLLSTFGLIAVTLMMVSYTLERRGRSFILLFAFACALGSVYGFLQGAWPFGVVEIVWAGVALWRWKSASSAREDQRANGEARLP